jgi:DNA-binding MarR family transcriptional regulator
MEELQIDRDVVFGVLSGKVSTAINRRLYRDFRAADILITPEQWTILLSLSYKDGITQQELATTTFRDKPSITRLIDNLEKNLLVVRLSNKADKRINLIHITKAGLALNEKAVKIALNVMKDALFGINEEEYRAGEQILKRIFINLM